MSGKPSLAFDLDANARRPEHGTVHHLWGHASVGPVPSSFTSSAPNTSVSRLFISISRMLDLGRFALCIAAVMGLAIYKGLPVMGVIVCAALALAFTRTGGALR